MKKVANTRVMVNNNAVELENRENLTLLDALIKAGYDRDVIMPREYKYVEIEFNGEPTKVHFGFESATKVFLNGERAGLLSLINHGDKIEVQEFEVTDQTTINLSALEEYNENIIFDIDGNPVPLLRLVEVNGRLNFGDVKVKNGDIVKTYNYYTAEQLRECLGLEEDIVIMAEETELIGDDAVYESTIVDTYVRLTEEREANLGRRNETTNFKLFVGDEYSYMDMKDEGNEVALDEISEIKVMLNGETIQLNNKKSYAVIDALDAANIDAMQAVGKDITIRVNGKKAAFSTVIEEADKLEFSFS